MLVASLTHVNPAPSCWWALLTLAWLLACPATTAIRAFSSLRNDLLIVADKLLIGQHDSMLSPSLLPCEELSLGSTGCACTSGLQVAEVFQQAGVAAVHARLAWAPEAGGTAAGID